MRKVLSGLAVLGLSASLQAAPVFYTDAGDFGTATTGYDLTTDTFEGISTSFSSFNYNGASGLNIASNARLSDRQNSSSACAGSSDCIGFSTPRGGSVQTFTFDSGAVNAFSLILGDLADVGGSTLTLTTSVGDSMSWTFPDQRNGLEKFFGVVDTMNTFVSLTMTNSDRGDFVGIDNVTWGTAPTAVPEPSSLALLGLGLAGLGFSRRMNKA